MNRLPYSRLTTLLLVATVAISVAAQPAAREQFLLRLVAAARARATHHVRYDGSYFSIPYPGGDVPADRGVCTDEVIRAYRAVGVDLQRDVHEDMAGHFSAYPKSWGLHRTDTNIDHRRVPNLIVFFKRNGETLPITRNGADYHPGDLVTWDLGGGVPHIGIVVDARGGDTRYKLLHNIGSGPQIEDVLFAWKITGHFRYYGR